MTEQKKAYIRQLMFANGTIESHHHTIESIIETIRLVVPETIDITLADIAEDVLNEIIPIYDNHFTEEQIIELIKFYKSDIGKTYLENMGSVAVESMKVGERMGTIISERIQRNKANKEIQNQLKEDLNGNIIP